MKIDLPHAKKMSRREENETIMSQLVQVERPKIGLEVQDDIQADVRAKKEDEIDQLIDKELQERLLQQKDHYILNREKYVQEKEFKEQEAKFGDYQARLVKRPQKNFLWGYGTQIFDEGRMDDENFFRKGQLPTIRELLNFLEIYQMKDMKVINLHALGRNEEQYAIICSGFSMRHIYHTAKILVQKLKSLECPEIVNRPRIAGTHDDSWLLVVVKQVQVHFLIEEYREELDLEFRWMNPPPPEMRKKWKLYHRLKRQGQSLDVDEETFAIKDEEDEEYFAKD